jgi:hypothetical protein
MAARMGAVVALTAVAGLATVSSVPFLFGVPDSEKFVDNTGEGAVLDHISKQPASAFQDNLLSDGELTESEYAAAFDAFESCVRAAGATFVPDPPQRDRWGTYISSVRVPPAPGVEHGQLERNPAVTAVKACQSEHFDRVQEWWTATHGPSREEVDAVIADMVACIEAKGFDVPAEQQGWSQAFLEAGIDSAKGAAFHECARAASAELGNPNFVPLP